MQTEEKSQKLQKQVESLQTEVVELRCTMEGEKKRLNELEVTLQKMRELEVMRMLSSTFPAISSDSISLIDNVGLCVAKQAIFHIDGDTSQSLDWGEYGLKIHFSPGAIPSSEVIVKALVGGKFLFPDGMQPVSALYVILFSHEVLQPVKLEIQHCVCLKSSQQFKYLSFITAPIDESAPPYKFQYIEGGKFYTDSQYGMIVRSKFCLMGVAKKINGGGSHTPSDSEQDSTSDDDASNSEPQVISANAGVQSIKKDMSHIDDVEAIESNQLVVQKPEEKFQDDINNTITVTDDISTEEIVDTPDDEAKEKKKFSGDDVLVSQDDPQNCDSELVVSKLTCSTTSKSHATSRDVQLTDDYCSPDNRYTGRVCYVRKNTNRWCMIFMVAQNVKVFLKHLEDHYSNADKAELIRFCFNDSINGFVELDLNTKQERSNKGWTIDPFTRPLMITMKDANLFGTDELPLPPSCMVNVFADSPKIADSYLSHRVALIGIYHVKEICIQRFLDTNNISEPTQKATSECHTASAVPNTGTDINTKKVKRYIQQIMEKNHDNFSWLFKSSMKSFADKLFSAGLITRDVLENPTNDTVINSFLSGFAFKDELDEIDEYCAIFFKVFHEMGGPFVAAANKVVKTIQETVRDNMGINLNIDV